jgi:hypothetical protein
MDNFIAPFFTAMIIRCSFKFILKVGAEESIVNAPLINLQSKNTNTQNVGLDLIS